MGTPELPCIPQRGGGPGCRGSSGTCKAGAARSSLPVFETPFSQRMPMCPASDSGRPGWHARKWQQGTFPRDIVQKEPKIGALGPNLPHWRSQEKINRAVRLRGEFAPEAASDGAPQCQLRSSQQRGCSPSPAACDGRPPRRAQLALPGQAGALPCPLLLPQPGAGGNPKPIWKSLIYGPKYSPRFCFALPAKCWFCPLLRALVIFEMLSANISLALHSHSSPLQLQIPSQ